MSIKRAPRKHSYTNINNQVFQNGVLSWRAMGLLSYVLSKPDNWNIIPDALVKVTEGTAKNDRRSTVYDILKELKDSGFVSMTRHGDGSVDYVVFDEPNLKNREEDTDPNLKNPNRDNPNLENPNRDNPHVLITTDYLTTTDVTVTTDFSSSEPEAPAIAVEKKTVPAKQKKAKADCAPAIELTSLQDAIPENLRFDKPVRFQSEWMEFECMKETFRTCFAEYEIQPMKRHWNLIADKFVDYWNTNATKAKKFENQDWRATFRNYCRDQLERHSQSWKREQKNQPNHANVINHPSMEKLTPKGQAGLAVAMRWLENQQTKSEGLMQ